MPQDHEEKLPERNEFHETRRVFIKQSSAVMALAMAPTIVLKATDNDPVTRDTSLKVPVSLHINGKPYQLSLEPRTTLLDLLREQLALTGTKKGCDHGQCGACTVHSDGKRINSCLTLAVMQEGKKITTIEGLAQGEELHPMQQAFIKHDGFQCGYCTPGQIMSGIACIREGHANSEEEIREFMSGNICRCGAYDNIVSAIQEVKEGGHNI
ncbi:(2Fe-2S)-binding protein [Chitinophaga sp. Cy-1792]|uniref:(2Fe-2S)-binding protein n=1 Tax=Chitinophaga sp. Cy-1792 TaxID=2608339 RepID=UPI00142486C3|nr:2Fe-2S iron-sulfur cluster-binding protein [Chitinophaga sp. Cy-1792]NIG57419.1 2Fe-2S iron-sulfur cluster binding domain-containing protein [Chitinophaga sp. Cy-1792]